MKTATVSVPGAILHYQVRGGGPLLLLLSGGGGDADALGALADSLESDYTVASYARGRTVAPFAAVLLWRQLHYRAVGVAHPVDAGGVHGDATDVVLA
jgi:hypothetical protein